MNIKFNLIHIYIYMNYITAKQYIYNCKTVYMSRPNKKIEHENHFKWEQAVQYI